MKNYIITNSGDSITSTVDFINFIRREIDKCECGIYKVVLNLRSTYVSIRLSTIRCDLVDPVSEIIIMKKDESFSKFKDIFNDIQNNHITIHGFLKELELKNIKVFSENDSIVHICDSIGYIHGTINKRNSISFINIDYLLPLDSFFIHSIKAANVKSPCLAVLMSVRDLSEECYEFYLDESAIIELFKIKKEQLSESEYTVFNMLIETSETGNPLSIIRNNIKEE